MTPCSCTTYGVCAACHPQREAELARTVAASLNALLDTVGYDERPPYPGHRWSDPDRLDRWDAAPQYADRKGRES